MITQTYSLDLVPNGALLVVAVSQYDTARKLIFSLYERGIAYDTANVASAVITGTKPDGLGFIVNATVDSGDVSVDLTEQMTAVAGTTTCEIILYDSNNKQLGSANFILSVEHAALADDTVISDSDISAINTAVRDTERHAYEVQQIANNVQLVVDQVQSVVPMNTGKAGDVLTKPSDTGGAFWQKQAADKVTYSVATSGLTATDVQGAIDEVAGKVDTITDDVNSLTAADITYVPETSWPPVTATDVQGAIDEVARRKVLPINAFYDSATDTFTFDKTFAEILARFTKGGMPFVLYKNIVFRLYRMTATSARFVLVNDAVTSYTGSNYPKQIKPGETALFILGSDDVVTFRNGGYYKSNSIEQDNTYWGSSTATLEERLNLLSPKYIEVTIPAASWTGGAYTYESADIPSPTYSRIEVLPPQVTTVSAARTFMQAAIVPINQSVGAVAICATGTVPTSDITVVLKITRNASAGHQ